MTESHDNEWITFYETMKQHKILQSCYLLDKDIRLGNDDINWSELANNNLFIKNKFLLVKTISDDCDYLTFVEITDESVKRGAMMVKFEEVRFVCVYNDPERALAQKVVFDYFKNGGENEE